MTQDGSTVGRLTKGGDHRGRHSLRHLQQRHHRQGGHGGHGQFANPRGLTQVGDTSWRQSLLSGDALPGTPNSGTFGSISRRPWSSPALDLTTELVDLITAQRNFQANSRSLEVNSSLQQNILQIR